MFTPLAFTKESIVTRGLVFHVDAADRTSYSPSNTVWNDLTSNNNDGTLTNGPTFDSGNGGNIIFDGSNDYATVGYQLPAQSSTTTFSWNLWIYLPSGNGGNDVIFGNRYSGNSGTQFTKITPTNWEYYNNGGRNVSYSIPTNQWINLCVIKDQETHYYYSNGSQIGTRTSVTLSIGAMPVFMGADGYSGVREPSNVKFASAAIYDRALSSTEVLQNYNALKGRFGL